MAKQVRETTAGAAISAYVVLNKKGEHVATVNAHYSNGGTVTVDVWNHGAAVMRSFETARKIGRVSEKNLATHADRAPDYYKEQADRINWVARDLYGLQQGRAGGYGYDKFAAALAGLIIDGHTMADHCSRVPEAEKARAALLRRYAKAVASGANGNGKEWREKAARMGCNFDNWGALGCGERFKSLHFIDGLNRLQSLGYRVIQAI